MPHISFHNKEITFKIVYFGPGWSGKTTNLVRIHARVGDDLRGDPVVLDTDQERTLFFDFLPMELGRIAGYAARLNLDTVPGQICYEASRRLILNGADGVVFVADSQPSRLDALSGERPGAVEVRTTVLRVFSPSLHQTDIGAVMATLERLGVADPFPSWEVWGVVIEPLRELRGRV